MACGQPYVCVGNQIAVYPCPAVGLLRAECNQAPSSRVRTNPPEIWRSLTMSTRWVITNAAEQVALNDQKHGETTFTVSNPTQRADRVVFDVVPGDGAEASWFSTTDPQR